MKLYAVVIGRKRINQQYVVYEPFSGGDNKNGRLAVYDTMVLAKKAKEKTLACCGHTDVFIIKFVPER